MQPLYDWFTLTLSQVTDMLPVVVVHGGSGHVPNERAENSTVGVCSAAQAAYHILQDGGSSMDAVVEAVTQLEDNPFFNAGTENQKIIWMRQNKKCLMITTKVTFL